MSEKLINQFVNACINLQIEFIEEIHGNYPAVFGDYKEFHTRIKFIFKAISIGNPSIRVEDSICTGCSYGEHVKVFRVCYEGAPEKDTNFAFLIEYENQQVKLIRECTQNKFYRDRLWRKMTKRLSEDEIIKLKISMNSLPNTKISNRYSKS